MVNELVSSEPDAVKSMRSSESKSVKLLNHELKVELPAEVIHVAPPMAALSTAAATELALRDSPVGEPSQGKPMDVLTTSTSFASAHSTAACKPPEVVAWAR